MEKEKNGGSRILPAPPSIGLNYPLRADERDGIAVIRITGLEHGTSLELIGRTRRQAGHDYRRFHHRRSLARPCSRDRAIHRNSVTDFVAESSVYDVDPGNDLAAVRSVFDLTDLFRKRLTLHFRGGRRLESARQEDRHVSIAGDFHVAGEQSQHLGNGL